MSATVKETQGFEKKRKVCDPVKETQGFEKKRKVFDPVEETQGFEKKRKVFDPVKENYGFEKKQKVFDQAKENYGFEKKRKVFDQSKKEFEQQKDIIKEAKHIMEEIYLESKNMAEKKEDYSEAIAHLKNEKKEIEKKQHANIEMEKLGLSISDNERKKIDDERKKIDDSKNKIDAKIKELEKKREDDIKKIIDHLTDYYKKFYAIKKAAGLADKQFKQSLIVAATEFLTTASSRASQTAQDTFKTMMKVVIEGKI